MTELTHEDVNEPIVERFVRTHIECIQEVGKVAGWNTAASASGSLLTTLSLRLGITPEEFRDYLAHVADGYEQAYFEHYALHQPVAGSA